MTMIRSSLRMFSFAVPLVIAGAPALMAQNRTLFSWTGRVDREVQITMRGRDVWTNGVDRDDSRGRVNVDSPLPRSDGYVRVQALDGRGDVSVVQQPSSWNNYTTIVRVRDRSSGSDRYRVNAYWESRYSDDRGGWGRRDGDDNGGWGRRDGDDNGGWHRGGDDYPSRIDPRNGSNGGWGYGNNSGTALRWAGNVDGEIELRLQGRRLDERVLSGGVIRDERSSVIGDMPRRDAQVFINQRQGRGTIYVAQQPSAYNGYTTVIRVRDPQGGYGYYDFEVDYR